LQVEAGVYHFSLDIHGSVGYPHDRQMSLPVEAVVAKIKGPLKLLEAFPGILKFNRHIHPTVPLQ